MKESLCFLENSSVCDDNSALIPTDESSCLSDILTTDLIAQLSIDKYSEHSDDSYLDDSDQHSPFVSDTRLCLGPDYRQQITVHQGGKGYKSKLITRKDSYGVKRVLVSHCASPRFNVPRKHFNKTVTPKCTSIFDDKCMVRRGGCNLCYYSTNEKRSKLSSESCKCLCSTCLYSRTPKSGKYVTRSIMKQNKPLQKVDYRSDHLKRKIATNQSTTVDTTHHNQPYSRSSSSSSLSKLSCYWGGSPTSDLYDITECLISESTHQPFLTKTEINKTNHDNNNSNHNNPVNNSQQLDDKLSAWECWLLEKERQKRKQWKELKKKQIEEIQKRNQILTQKFNRKIISEQKCKEWIEIKQKERKKFKKLQEIKKKDEELKKLQEFNERIEKAKLKYEGWCRKKAEENNRKLHHAKQIELNKQLTNQSRKEASIAAYSHWLKSVGRKRSISCYSHGYSDGKLIDYYDRTANPPPSFVNPNPWINPTDLIEETAVRE
ncbi:hypothetical protein MN116_008446 [Schistosoma mekongi]|uniref:Coiled-coil domain-containing protein n=1 Tax=Schistosoma mekongi TaxID=38744 RepID=A0AAE2D2U4_SCHME|nr:hypothetical protein MN116_008446 [Schistosoma mekongi]